MVEKDDIDATADAADRLEGLRAASADIDLRGFEEQLLDQIAAAMLQEHEQLDPVAAAHAARRRLRAHFAGVLGVGEDHVDETLLNMPVDALAAITPSPAAAGRGARRVIARVACDTPELLGAMLVTVLGARRVLGMVEIAVAQDAAENRTLGHRAANLHKTPTEAQ